MVGYPSGGIKCDRIPINSIRIFSCAGSFLVSGGDQRPLLPEPRVSMPEQSLSMSVG
jgi:hypothetical protein